MNPDSSISKIYDNAQKYQNGSTSIRSHESLHQNSHPSDEHDKYNNPRNDGDSQGELPEDPCFKADPNYNPFDNEEDYKLPEETTLEDESNLWFVHQGFENEGNTMDIEPISYSRESLYLDQHVYFQ